MMMMSQSVVNSIHFENWSPNHVAEWLGGLDDVILPYGSLFLEHNIDGKRLLMLTPYDLEKINIHKLGHQELIMEAVDQLRTLRYGYEMENLQHLALQLGCKARSLHNEIQAKSAENDQNQANVSPGPHPRRLSSSVLSALADMIMSLKNIVSWLDRSPFESIYGLCLLRNTIVKLGIDLVTTSQQDNKQNDVEENIIKGCNILADVCDELVKNNKESLVVQPASLEEATIRKKPGEELGMNIQTSYIGIHVIGGIKPMSPADLCGKIEKGDEVIQVNHKTVVGWQLTKLVRTLKEKPKEVTLLLKKRPHHISPYGHVPNKKKQIPKTTVSTLPKTTKKRRSRESDQKQQRPSLQELVSNVIVDDIESPREERTSDEKDDGNDTDNEVFRSGSESPQYVKPSTVDPKQRRATVSGGSPTLSRPLLVIEDIDTPTRPKSFTVAATDAPQIEFKNLGIPGEESNLVRLGDANKVVNAQQKRQEFRSARSTPPSLEFTVKKPTPIVQEPPPQLKLTKPEQDSKQEVTETVDKATEEDSDGPKSALELLEVPSRFQNYSGQSSGTDEDGDSTESGQPKVNTTSSSDTLTEDTLDKSQENLDQGSEKESALQENTVSETGDITRETTPKSDTINMAGSTTDDPNTEGTKSDQAVDPNGNSQNNNPDNVSNDQITDQNSDQIIDQNSNNTASTDANSNQLASATSNNNQVIQNQETAKSNNADPRRKPIPAERLSKTKSKSQIQQTAPKELHASGVDFEKCRMVPAASDVALPTKTKNQPTLMMIRKRESVTQADMDKRREEQIAASSPQRKEDLEERDTVPDISQGGYKIVIANGVPQKIPISSEPPVQMRHSRKKTKKVNRRVSCKDLGEGDCQGWLYKEKSKGPLSKHWLKRWCVLKRQNLFCYRDNEDLKAESVIHLPSFQVSPAPDIKTKKFAFKVHNSGTTFVFASERQDDMSKWMNKLGLAAIDVNPSEGVLRVHKKSSPNDDFSESEDEEEGNTSKSSEGSSVSVPDSPVVQRSTNSEEDITSMMRNIEKACVTLEGKDKGEERRKTLGKLDEDNLPSPEQIKMKRMHSLQRTLKAKEKELADIEELLSTRAPKEALKDFEQKYSEFSSHTDPGWQSSDSDSDNVESTAVQ